MRIQTELGVFALSVALCSHSVCAAVSGGAVTIEPESQPAQIHPYVVASRSGDSAKSRRDSKSGPSTEAAKAQDRDSRRPSSEGTNDLQEGLRLVEALDDRDGSVQREAERGLREVVDSLAKDLDSFTTEKRSSAVQGLGMLASALGNTLQRGDSRAQSAAADVLRAMAKSTRDSLRALKSETRTAAAEAWGDIARAGCRGIEYGDSRAQRESRDLLDQLGKEVADLLVKTDPRVRETGYTVVRAIARPLARLSAQDSRSQRAAGDELERLAERVAEVLSAADPGVRADAARGLGEIGEPRGVEPLIEALGDQDAQVRREAHMALTSIARQDLGEDPQKWKEWWDKRDGR